MTKHSDGSQSVATKSLTQSRRLRQWAVSYSSIVECEYGHEHKVSNVLVGLETEAEAKEQAKELKGKVKREWWTPKLSDEEIKLLNKTGTPVKRSSYGLTFEDMPVAFSDSPESLDSIRQLYKHYPGNDLANTSPDTTSDVSNPQSNTKEI